MTHITAHDKHVSILSANTYIRRAKRDQRKSKNQVLLSKEYVGHDGVLSTRLMVGLMG